MYVLILNPVSGRGAALERLKEIEALLTGRGLRYRVDQAGDAPGVRELARRAVSEEATEGVIAVGGDGTLFDVANGVVGSDVPLLFVSCGTGNDFVRTLKLPADPVEALALQLDTPVGSIDVGKMNDTYFLNVSGTGFDVEVLRNTEKYKDRCTGLRAYLYGLHDAVKSYKPMEAMISIDGAPEQLRRFAILSIGNGRYIGGGMKAVPDACVNDGLLDVVIVKPIHRLAILPLIIFFITGRHVKLRLGASLRCKSIRVRRAKTCFNLDGELLYADSADYRICPAALRVRVPGMEIHS